MLLKLLSIGVVCVLAAPSALADEDAESSSEQKAIRRAESESLPPLMSASLKGLHKIYWRTGLLSPAVEKQFLAELSQTGVELVQNDKPVKMAYDAGYLTIMPNATTLNGTCEVELTLFQDCSLMIDKTSHIRAQTYVDYATTDPSDVGKGVQEVTAKFVISFLKANSISPK